MSAQPPGGAVPQRRLANFYFWYFAFIGVFATYFSLYLQSIGLTAGEIGVLMASLQATRVFAPGLWGWLSDHTGRPIAILRRAFAGATVVFAAMFFVESFGGLLAVIVVMSTLWSAVMPLFESATLAWLAGDTARYGRIRLWGSVGFILAVAAAGAWLDHVAIACLLWLVLALMLATAAFSFSVRERAVDPHDHVHVPVWQVLRRPEIAAFFTACFLMLASQGASYVFYSIYMVEQGFSKAVVGLLWSVGVIAEILVFMQLPRLLARFSHYHLWVLSFALTALRYLVVAWFPEVLALQFFAQALHMFTFGTFHATALAVLHRAFPGRLRTRGQGLYTSVSFGLGGAAGGLASGWTWTHWGPQWTFTVSAALALAGLLVVLARPGALRALRSAPLDGPAGTTAKLGGAETR